MREKGYIKKWFEDNGYGFIRRGGAPDVFLHIHAFRDKCAIVSEGRDVEFEVVRGEKGLKAVDVVLI